jgi:hypothetical protein
MKKTPLQQLVDKAYQSIFKGYKKLFDEFGEPTQLTIPIPFAHLDNAIAIAEQYWPKAKVTGYHVISLDGQSGIEILFSQMQKNND